VLIFHSSDRVAQRAIRERTKNQIDALERRIEELTSQQPYQELQAVIKAKEAVERENATIKRRLAALIGELQPLIGAGRFRDAALPLGTTIPANTG
jgi:FtsZ-binding cell division protein ZapB